MAENEKTKNKIRFPWRELIAFFITALCMVGLLAAVAKIPREKLRPQMERSADYMCIRALHGHLIRGVKGTLVDRYADSVLLAIAWQYDEEHPFYSSMWSAYYHQDDQNENFNFADAVKNNLPANQQYLRYWHGSIAIVRPLMQLFDISGVYRWNAVWLLILLGLLLYLLIRRKAYIPLAALIIGFIMTSSWIVPLSLEYTWTYVIMLIISILVCILTYREKQAWYGVLFLCSGMITNYLDFLTTETITLTVPLLLLLWFDHKDSVKKAVSLGITWLTGYVCTWVLKWILASIAIKENAMPYVAEHIAERLGGEGYSKHGLKDFLSGVLFRNMKLLFPFEYGAFGLVLGISLILLYVYLLFVYRSSRFDKKRVFLFVLIGCVPYIRYLVLSNHAFFHNFFTYRAQLGTIFAFIMILNEIGSLDAVKRRVFHAGKK